MDTATSLTGADVIADFADGDRIDIGSSATNVWYRHLDADRDGRTDTVLYDNAAVVAGLSKAGLIPDINVVLDSQANAELAKLRAPSSSDIARQLQAPGFDADSARDFLENIDPDYTNPGPRQTYPDMPPTVPMTGVIGRRDDNEPDAAIHDDSPQELTLLLDVI